MTPKATQTAWKAMRFWTLAGRPAVRARKIGVIPGGSIITKSVRKRDPKTAASNTVGCLARVVRKGGSRCVRGASGAASAGARHREGARRAPRDLPVDLGVGGVLAEHARLAAAVVVRGPGDQQAD